MNNPFKKETINTTEFKQSLWFIIAGLLISLMLIFGFARVITGISASMTYDTTMSVKKNMLRDNVNNMIIYLEEEREDYLVHYPDAGEDEIEEAMIQVARKRIYSEQHGDGAYMWIQKVLNYDGGDDYAIRLIHPNLSDTEGCYLSTNEVNQMGMKAYEEELNGVKENGEIYLNYAFKKLNSNEVTEKETFSKLYPRYDWIICMGVNIDDMDHYMQEAEKHIRTYRILILGLIAATWLTLLFLMFFVYRRTHVKAFEKKNKELKDKLNWDALTNANSRSFGEKQLERELNEFKKGKKNTLVLMMDVDFFKQFNDGYGHDLGDKVLQSFVTAIKNCTRSTDSVIRWGGDEFVVILQNIPHRFQPEIGDKILDAVRSIRLEELEADARQITASMGFTYFKEDDTEYKDTLARADEALYKAKESGRNNWKIQ